MRSIALNPTQTEGGIVGPPVSLKMTTEAMLCSIDTKFLYFSQNLIGKTARKKMDFHLVFKLAIEWGLVTPLVLIFGYVPYLWVTNYRPSFKSLAVVEV